MIVFYEFVRFMFMFALGGMIGWCFEFIFRSVRARKVVNPGFVTGPVLPIYGFGMAILYYLCKIPLPIDNEWLYALVLFPVMAGILTLLEFLGGLLLVKGMNLRLWDYSRRKGNIMGIICPLVSCIWGLCGVGFYYVMYPWLITISETFIHNIVCVLLIGLWYGVYFVDLGFSLHIATKIKNASNHFRQVFEWEETKVLIYSERGLSGKKRPSFFIIPLLYRYFLLQNERMQRKESKKTE